MKYSKYLVFIIGTTPQIITETIFSLAVERKWIPDNLIIYTTQVGNEIIRDNLINKNYFNNLIKELNLNLKLDKIEIIEHEGNPLYDIRSINDNYLFADFIINNIFQLCNDSSKQVYVSLAGGRKTMSYYVGYAMSLYGKNNDKLLHVLINEPFDNISDFYYPTKDNISFQYKNRTVDSSMAKIELIDIPFIRLRYSIPYKLLDGKSSFKNSIIETQNQLYKINNNITINLLKLEISINNITLRLYPSYFVIYYYFIQLQQNFVAIKHVNCTELLVYYASIVTNGTNSARYRQFEKSLNDIDFESLLRTSITKINNLIKKNFETFSYELLIKSRKNNNIKNYGIGIDSKRINIIES